MIELRGTNAKKNQFTVALYVDDMRLEKKDRAVDEPIYFYTQGTRAPLELVVNSDRQRQSRRLRERAEASTRAGSSGFRGSAPASKLRQSARATRGLYRRAGPNALPVFFVAARDWRAPECFQ